jgi:hypothetical protein
VDVPAYGSGVRDGTTVPQRTCQMGFAGITAAGSVGSALGRTEQTVTR